MTIKEAARRIRVHANHHKISEPRDVLIVEALEMGAQALEQIDEGMTHNTRLSPAKDTSATTAPYDGKGAPFDEPPPDWC